MPVRKSRRHFLLALAALLTRHFLSMRGHLWTIIALAGCACVSSAEPRGTMGAEGVGCSALISVLSMSTSDALLAMLGGYAVARSRSSGLAAYVPAMLAAPLVFRGIYRSVRLIRPSCCDTYNSMHSTCVIMTGANTGHLTM